MWTPLGARRSAFFRSLPTRWGWPLDAALSFEASERAQQELHRKHAELQAERDRLQLLLEVTSQAVSTLDLRDLLRAVSASVRRMMQCDGVGVALADCDGRHLRIHALDFPESKGIIQEEREIPIGESHLGTAFQTGQAVVLNRIDLSEAPPETLAIAAAEGIQILLRRYRWSAAIARLAFWRSRDGGRCRSARKKFTS